jgi:hypothetical protein
MTRKRLTRALTTIASLAAVQWVSAQQPIQSPVDRVKGLYESAAYDDALATIDRIGTLPAAGGPSESAVLLRYRALCLLALDRSPEAEGAVEQLLLQDPVYFADPNDTSPRFVTVLDRTRNRVLPQLAQKQYDDAKRNYDQRRLQEAASGFARVIAMLDNPTLDRSALGASRDLRTLAAGFLELSRAGAQQPPPQVADRPPASREPARTGAPAPQQVAERSPALGREPARAATKPPATTDRSPATGREPGRPGATSAQTGRQASANRAVYSDADRDVTPPVIVRQDLPPWKSGPLGLFGRFEGQIDIVVDETGSVETAALTKSIFPAYDELAVAGTKEWKYRPAMKNGVPVRFKKSVLIRLFVKK